MKSILKFLLIAFMCSNVFGDVRNYKIALWNLNHTTLPIELAWQHTIRGLLLGENGADVLMLQGVGGVPSTSYFLNTFKLPLANQIPIQEYQWSLGANYSSVFIYFVQVDSDAKAINLAIVSKKRAQEIIIIKAPTKYSLPILGVRFENDVFLSMQSMSQKGEDTKAIIQATYNYFLKQPQIQWLLAGSFNTTPASLQESLDSKIQEQIAIISPDVPTRKSGKILDYAIAGNSGMTPYLAPALRSFLMYGNLYVKFDSDYIPIGFSK